MEPMKPYNPDQDVDRWGYRLGDHHFEPQPLRVRDALKIAAILVAIFGAWAFGIWTVISWIV